MYGVRSQLIFLSRKVASHALQQLLVSPSITLSLNSQNMYYPPSCYFHMASCDTYWPVPTEHVKSIACARLREIRNVSLTLLDRCHCSSTALLCCTESKTATVNFASCDRRLKCHHLHFHSSLVRGIVWSPYGTWHVCF